jgi:hypothetical protein
MKTLHWLLALSLGAACGDTEGGTPDARAAVLDGAVVDAPPFSLPDARPAPPDAAPPMPDAD